MSDQNTLKKSLVLDKKKVLVALTGRADSMVAAYLLKKQGYKVYGLGIVFQPRMKEEDCFDSKEDDVAKPVGFEGVYLLDKPEEVRNICEKMEIPFYAADASSVYQYYITDRVIAARVEGISYAPKVYATEVIFRVLEEKAKRLGCYWMATGHYTKIIKNQKTRDHNIYISNDSQYDQSFFFSRLGQEVLGRTLLPLSEMRRQEVEKVANLLGVELLSSRENFPDLMKSEALTGFVAQRVPRAIIKRGSIIDCKSGFILDDHDGIHYYFLGQKNLKSRMGNPLEPELTVSQINYRNGNIYLAYPDDIKLKCLFIRDLVIQDQLDITKSLDVFIRLHSGGEFLSAVLHFKNNDYAFIELKETRKIHVFPGDYCVIYSRSEGAARILASGMVKKGGVMDGRNILSLPKQDDDFDNDNENEKDNKEKDISSFYF